MRKVGLLLVVGVLLGVLVRGVDGQGVGDSPLDSPIDPISWIQSGDLAPEAGEDAAMEIVPMVLPEAGGDIGYWVLEIWGWVLEVVKWIVFS